MRIEERIKQRYVSIQGGGALRFKARVGLLDLYLFYDKDLEKKAT